MSENGWKNFEDPFTGLSEFGASEFLVWQILSRIGTATLVRIESVTNAGGVSPVGYVDVLPLVNQVDSGGNAVPHGVIHRLPYFRLQGGADAVILDPKAGDIGIAVFASRDISAVKASKGQNVPGSSRMFDMADGLYIGGVLNGTPSQYVQFSGGGITIHSPTKVRVEAPGVDVVCEKSTVSASESASVTAPAISLGASGQSLRSFVTSAFMALFNGHTHPANGAVPTQQMNNSHMTTTVKGG